MAKIARSKTHNMTNFSSIALLGDGIFGRWGADCDELNSELTRLYTHSTFHISNYGRDDSRIGNALWRVANDSGDAKNLAYTNPDITIIESCAYTQFWDGPEGLSEYRDILRRIWDEIERTTTSKRLFCLAAAPPRGEFLDGLDAFHNTSKATRGRFADGVKMFIDEARAIAEDEGWPIADIDAEAQKRAKDGENARRFYDQNGNLYPSRYGYQLAARVIVRELDNHRFIEERIAK